MNNPGLFQARWGLRRMALCNFLPLVLLANWLWPTGQRLCVVFDEWRFHPSTRCWRLTRYGYTFGQLQACVLSMRWLGLLFIRMLLAKFAGQASAAHSFASKPAPTLEC